MRGPASGTVPVLLIGLGVAVVSLLLLRRPSETPVDVDLQAIGAARPAPEPEALRLAVAPVWTPERLVDEYQHFADWLAARLGRPVRLVLRQTYGEVNELLRCGSAQVAIICTGALLDARQNQIPLDIVASPVCKGETTYRSLIIVRADSQFRTVDDLAGHAFAYSDLLSFSGHYYPLALLIDQGRDPSTFFSRTTFTHGHDASIHAVLDGSADAAAVDSLVFDFEVRAHPNVGDNLRVIQRSPPLPICPIVASRFLEPGLLKDVREALLSMNESPEGKKVLESLQIDRFAAPAAADLEAPAALYMRVRNYLESRR